MDSSVASGVGLLMILPQSASGNQAPETAGLRHIPGLHLLGLKAKDEVPGGLYSSGGYRVLGVPHP